MVRANVSKVWARSLRTTVACRTGARRNTSAHISAGRSSGGFPFVVNVFADRFANDSRTALSKNS